MPAIQPPLKKPQKLSRQWAAKAIVLKGDVADTAVCEDMIKQAVAELGRLDILVNNAGITRDGLLSV